MWKIDQQMLSSPVVIEEELSTGGGMLCFLLVSKSNLKPCLAMSMTLLIFYVASSWRAETRIPRLCLGTGAS